VSDLTADRIALRALVEEYAHGCDTRDADALRACFADGATLTVHWIGREATTMTFPAGAEHIAGSLARYDRTLHFVGNHRAEIDGDDATAVAYCFAHHILGTTDHVMAIRYLDAYRRGADGWRIVERHLHLDWTEDTTVTV
jgi:ketosteroid isomerase-like protein